MMLPKPVRKRDAQYLEWIRKQPCLVTHKVTQITDIFDSRYIVEAHHVREEGKGGMGTKPDDSRAVPLMGWAHDRYHQVGRKAFEWQFALNLEAEIARLNREYARTEPRSRRERQQKRITRNKKQILRIREAVELSGARLPWRA